MAKFNKRTTPTYTVSPNPIYHDLYDNNKETFDLQSGVVSDVRKTTVIINDYTMPSAPTFGNAKLIGAKVGLYINSITTGDAASVAGIRAFKMKVPVGDNEGGKSSVGTLIDDEDIVQICAYHDSGSLYINENFNGNIPSNIDLANPTATVTYNTGPYLSKSDGYDYGQRYGGKAFGGRFNPNKVSKKTHHNRYGQTSEVEGEHYKIQKGDGLYSYAFQATYYVSVKEKKLLHGFNREKWKDSQVGHYWSGGYAKNNVKIKYSSTITIENPIKDNFATITKTNTFLDGVVAHQQSFLDDDTEVAYGKVTFSSEALTGGHSCRMHSLYKSRYNTVCNIYYSPKKGLDGGQNQQVTFISKILPLPAHFYSREPAPLGDGRQPVTPTVDINLKIDKLAPMLLRDSTALSGGALGGRAGHDYRLNRAIVITFGEEPPRSNDNLYTYLLEHAPNSASDGTGSGTGLGTSAKSIFGLAFVRYNGKIGTYNLGSAGKSGSTYTDSTWVLDTKFREVCFAAAPAIDHEGEYDSNWMTLSIQLHPNDQGAYYMAHNENGKVLSHDDPYSSNKLVNLKNLTASGTYGIYADNMTYPAKNMTIWVNNYQAVKGAYNAVADMYATGLRAESANAGESSVNLLVHSVYSVTSALGTTETINSRSVLDSAYLSVDGGQDLTLALTDGTNAQNVLAKENSNALVSEAPKIELDVAAAWSDDDYVYFTAGSEPDMQITNHKEDCETDLYIDNISLKYFNMMHENATPKLKGGVTSALSIPTTQFLPNTAWQDGSSAVTNAFDNATQQPSYICLGFSDINKLEGSKKLLLMNGFSQGTSFIGDNIYTNVDSDLSNIRVGYSSTMENYGRQGAKNSTRGSGAVIHPDIGNGESPVLSNAGGSPTSAYRGLTVGDIDTSEFSVESTDAGNVDYFSQKGVMRFNFDSVVRKLDSDVNTANELGPVSGDVVIHVADGSGAAFSVNKVIYIDSEEMLITDVDSSGDPDEITVERGHNGSVIAEHSTGADIYHIASPAKRECIFASARVLQVIDKKSLEIDDVSIFNCKDGEEYILYKYNDAYGYASASAATAGVHKTLTISEITDNIVTFDKSHGVNRAISGSGISNHHDAFFISPKRYWLIIEILNIGPISGWQDESDSMIFLPEKNYTNLVGINEIGNYGATYNESLYNDGRYINSWSIEPYEKTLDSIIDLKDYGFGDFNEEDESGGHLGFLGLNINNDLSKFKEIDVSGAVSVDSLDVDDTLPILFTTDDPMDNISFNIDTEIGTYPTYLTGIFEDEVPIIKDFKVSPNEENAYNLDFTWSCSDDDAWYGFLIVDTKFVHHQYQNAIIYYPFNEEGSHGVKVPVSSPPVEKISGQTTVLKPHSGFQPTGPFYDIEGLAGTCLKNATKIDQAWLSPVSPNIRVGTGSADPLVDVTDEMSISFHFTHELDADGTLSVAEYLLYCTQQLYLWIDTNARLNYRQYWDTDSYIELQSTSTVSLDGEAPTNVMITFDANLTHGNVKMFVNGKLEDITGEVITADASDEQTGWYYGQNLESNNNYLNIGNRSDSHDNEFLGKFEELVIYNTVLYPVTPIDGKYTFMKPLKEVATALSDTSSISYNARLFIKDYHNIRGYTSSEVGMTSNISFKKAAFRFDNS